MNLIQELLEITYDRELELEAKLEASYRTDLWFLEETKETNIQIQIACLKYLENNRRLLIHESTTKH